MKMNREEVLTAFLLGNLVKAQGVIGKLLCVDDRDNTVRMENGDGWVKWSDLSRVDEAEEAKIKGHRKQIRETSRTVLEATAPVILSKSAIDRLADVEDAADLRLVGVLPDGKVLTVRLNGHGDLIKLSLDLSADDLELVES
jgi:hypothetical protein